MIWTVETDPGRHTGDIGSTQRSTRLLLNSVGLSCTIRRVRLRRSGYNWSQLPRDTAPQFGLYWHGYVQSSRGFASQDSTLSENPSTNGRELLSEDTRQHFNDGDLRSQANWTRRDHCTRLSQQSISQTSHSVLFQGKISVDFYSVTITATLIALHSNTILNWRFSFTLSLARPNSPVRGLNYFFFPRHDGVYLCTAHFSRIIITNCVWDCNKRYMYRVRSITARRNWAKVLQYFWAIYSSLSLSLSLSLGAQLLYTSKRALPFVRKRAWAVAEKGRFFTGSI